MVSNAFVWQVSKDAPAGAHVFEFATSSQTLGNKTRRRPARARRLGRRGIVAQIKLAPRRWPVNRCRLIEQLAARSIIRSPVNSNRLRGRP